MKTQKITLTFLCVALSVICFADISFRNYDIEKAKGVAKIENRNILVTYSADWCLPCKLLDQGAFRDQRLTTFMNQEFVNIKARRENKEEAEWFTKYKVNELPVILILNPQGEKIFEINGLMTASVLYNSFNQFKNGQVPENFIDYQEKYIIENNITNVSDIKHNKELADRDVYEENSIQVFLQFGRYRSLKKANAKRKKLLEKNISTIVLEEKEGKKIKYLVLMDRLMDYGNACVLFERYASDKIDCSLKFSNAQTGQSEQ